MRTLRKKLVRDLWRLRYQCLTIALLVGCGIAGFVAAMSASASVRASRDAFYADAHFADVFAHLKSAPRPVLDRLREMPGVAAVEGRVVGDFRLVIEGSDEPVVARFVSVSWPADAHLDQTRIQSGRQVEPGSSDEIVLSQGFAETWGFIPDRRSSLSSTGGAPGSRSSVSPSLRSSYGHPNRAPVCPIPGTSASRGWMARAWQKPRASWVVSTT